MDSNDVEEIIHIRKSRLDQIMLKAKMWDERENYLREHGLHNSPITTDLTQVDEWKDKAKKYDEITKLVRSLGTLNLYALSKKIEEMLRYD